MNEDRPWLGDEPTGGPDTSFPPGPTGFGVFLAVAGPLVFIGVARAEGVSAVIVVVGLIAGVVAGFAAAAWVGGENPPGGGTPST